MRYELPFALDDQFVILREIKAGGFGIVYAGWDENLNLPIAVKEIHPELLGHESGAQSFLAEAQLIARLDHRGIARLYTLKRSQGRVFMIMEYIEGGDLRQLQSFLKERDRKLSPAVCLYIIREVGKALHYAHVRVDPSTGAPLHLVHRDIAPSNFMISRMGAVKLIDFGIARVAGVVRPETMGGVIKGRPQYMSPEQITAPDTLDHRSDIYSLAIVFLDMLTGQSVYGKTTNEYQLLDRVKGRQFDLPEFFSEHAIPSELRAPIESALSLVPGDRTATAREFIDQLEPYRQVIHYDENKAMAELRGAAELAFLPMSLKRDLEQFHAMRNSAATVTIQLPTRGQQYGETQVIAPSTVEISAPSRDIEVVRKPVNWTAWALGLIAIGFVAAFLWLLTQQQAIPFDSRWQLTAEDSLRIIAGRRQDSIFAEAKRMQDSLERAALHSSPVVIPATEIAATNPIETPKKVTPQEPERVLPKLDRSGSSSPALHEFTIRCAAAAVVSVGGTFQGRVGAGAPLVLPATDSRESISMQVETGRGCNQTRIFDAVFMGDGVTFDPDTSLVMAVIRFAGSATNGVTTQIRALSTFIQMNERCEIMEPGRDYRFLPGLYEITTTAPGMNPRVDKRYLSAGKLITYSAG